MPYPDWDVYGADVGAGLLVFFAAGGQGQCPQEES